MIETKVSPQIEDCAKGLFQYKDTDIWCDKLGNIYVLKQTLRKLKPKNKKGNYLSVWVPSIGKTLKAHKIIAETFLKKDTGRNQVNHINGNKQDNRVENLEWCTPLENVRHYLETNNICTYEMMKKVRKPVKRVIMSKNGEDILIFDSAKEASEFSGICYRRITGCCNKEKYRKTAGGFEWRWYGEGN